MMRFALILAAPALVLAACAPVTPAPVASVQQGAAVEFVSFEELATMVDSGEVVLIDVRTPEEFAAGRLPGSLNAPLQTFDPQSIPVEAARETILYCGSSRRSAIAAEQLAAYLNRPVRHLEGGIQAWQDAGGEVIRSPE